MYGNKDSLTKIFTLVKIEEKGIEEEEVGGIYFKLSNIKKLDLYGEHHTSTIEFKFIIAEKFRNKEENFICSVNRGDIINIRSEYVESYHDSFSDPQSFVTFPIFNFKNLRGKRINDFNVFSLHTATLTFLFKEMNFPNVLLDD